MPNYPYTNYQTGLDDFDQPTYPAYVLGTCCICGEEVNSENDPAEMHNPENPEEEGGVCHAQCGLDRGWIVS